MLPKIRFFLILRKLKTYSTGKTLPNPKTRHKNPSMTSEITQVVG